jgi:hypothetical protein
MTTEKMGDCNKMRYILAVTTRDVAFTSGVCYTQNCQMYLHKIYESKPEANAMRVEFLKIKGCLPDNVMDIKIIPCPVD